MSMEDLQAVAVLSNKEVERIIRKQFEGNNEISQETFWENYQKLSEGVSTGYGSLADPEDLKTIFELKNNVAVFSAFKANRYSSQMSELLVDKDNKKRGWSYFLNEAKKVDATYNKTWLAAEYNMATRQSRSAKQWKQFERDASVYPNLMYMPSRSATPDVNHVKYYGLIFPLNHSFWDTAMPPLRFGCKCYVTQTREEPTDKEVEAPEVLDGVAGNAGKSKQIFTPSSHYIQDIAKADKVKVKTFLDENMANNKELINFKVGKNSVVVPVNADAQTLSKNINFIVPCSKQLKQNFAINPKGDVGELRQTKTKGDLLSLADAKDGKALIQDSFKKIYNVKLVKETKCFLAMDFEGKISKTNVDETWKTLVDESAPAERLSFVLIKNGDKVFKFYPNKTSASDLEVFKKAII